VYNNNYRSFKVLKFNDILFHCSWHYRLRRCLEGVEWLPSWEDHYLSRWSWGRTTVGCA